MTIAFLERASALSEAGAHEQALALLDAALRTESALAGGVARLHAARGWALENLGAARRPEARGAYEAALALDNGDLWARLGLATVLGKLDQAEVAQALYRDLVHQAGARAGVEPEYIELLGWCEYRMGRFDAAIGSFQRALAIDPDWLSVRFDLGLVLLIRGDGEGALAHYAKGLTQCRHGAAPGSGRAALKVALDDFDDAWRNTSALGFNPPAREIRALLQHALHAATPCHG